VVIGCRDQVKGNAAVEQIKNETGIDVFIKPVDLSSLESVRTFAKDLLENESKIHILILNAGIYTNCISHMYC